MKLLNYIVRFPFPDWSELTDNDGKLIKKPICYCWLQMGEDKEVTYGFDNEIASDFLKTLFPKFLMVDESGVKECLFNKLPPGEICFYDDGERIEMLKKTFFEYFLNKKKNELLKKRGGRDENNVDINLMPLELNAGVSSESINNCLKSNLPVLIMRFFTPEAGDTFVIFDEGLDSQIRKLAEKLGVKYEEYKDINELPTPRW